MILFIKLTPPDFCFVREVMGLFGTAILIREEEGDEASVQAALPWKIEHFPFFYLGLQISISRLTRSNWQLVVDAALKLLPGW